MNARDLITSDPFTVTPTDTVARAVEISKPKEARSLPNATALLKRNRDHECAARRRVTAI